MVAVGHDGEVEVIDGDRLRLLELEPLADLVAELRAPEGHGVAVEGALAPVRQVTGQSARRGDHEVRSRPRGRATQQAVDGVVGRIG